MVESQKIEELVTLVKETRELVRDERQLNNSRFTQLSTGVIEVTQKIAQVEKNLSQKIDHVYDCLSADIQAFAGDLERLKRKVG